MHSEPPKNDPIIMYLIVRKSLEMSAGKIGAQCAHAAQMLVLKFVELEQNANLNNHLQTNQHQNVLIFKKWLSSDFRKVVLKASDKDWENIKKYLASQTEVPYSVVVDIGLTEIAAQSETVIGLFPMVKSTCPKVIKKLQLL